MTDDWKPGDLALCVCGGSWTPSEPFDPQPGAVLTVRAFDNTPGDPGLWFASLPSCESYAAWAFRKINPLSIGEREEAMRDLKLPENV
jgi:hypothetical protein